ncbi:MAG: S53 family peptidase [Candidatus Sungbacteria bacterium]|uniref:S53 family peptidase n=1 Tax=Candidatus Sungiibacteriota bacterium TaxID=2750080 RepID=A0A9D6QRS1_9BACT|nr:S53 family peptidase [Candidatus Sungbacteria bacterium]
MKTFLVLSLAVSFLVAAPVKAAYHFSDFRGRPPIHVNGSSSKTPKGITPDQIKKIYRLPAGGGSGTIAIIGAYDDPSIEADVNDFSRQFNLPVCTTANDCFEKHKMSPSMKSDSGWAMEITLDAEWAHAVAPRAKILLVEATTPSGANLLKAVDYAASRKDAVSISMSWGGAEFPEETTLDSHFISKSGAVFFASSGDNGAGASWPAASPNVIGVGGTSLQLKSDGTLSKETAWSGSGGGVSAYEKQPDYQTNYSIPRAKGLRAIPDVAYDADPISGFPIIRLGTWREVGGTSAGAPQWAAIAALSNGFSIQDLYKDKAASNSAKFFRDITSGSNGSCAYYCDARRHYDYVTGLGTPLTTNF